MSIFIEASSVEVFGIDTPVQHLYLLHRDENGVERVLRAGASNEIVIGATMAVEVNLRIERSSDARGDETPEDRGSTEILFPSLGPDAAWALMVRYAEAIAEADYAYNPLRENSNAFVGALLDAAGGAPLDLLPEGISPDEAFGIAEFAEIIADIPPPADGRLRGTVADDQLVGIQVGEAIHARAGDDTVAARRGDDTVHGGAGDDDLAGGPGDDRVMGGRGQDILRDGLGGDVLIGGRGADVFVLTDDGQDDVIEDFQTGRDLIDLSRLGVADLAQLEIVAEGPAVRVRVSETDLLVTADAPLTASDFLFA